MCSVRWSTLRLACFDFCSFLYMYQSCISCDGYGHWFDVAMYRIDLPVIILHCTTECMVTTYISLVHAVSSHRDGRTLRDDEIIGMLIGFLLAGQHTSSTTSAWVGFYLARHKQLQVNGSLCMNCLGMLRYVVVKLFGMYCFVHLKIITLRYVRLLSAYFHTECSLPGAVEGLW